ncbi:hypothetical protein NA57DRAFT_34311 [Rhizodiscina lignyota]|uniref:RNA polymerase II subunit A C-terminal domain phosphatase n=1 Tax=Rhizodiscina lignyota TaxID=1504668 RepID=A0A9P4IHE3_9PEZI|nr:hypothetical protein NA57DRAFT_34311 [Rhizodiscina lignyota]
MLLRSSKLRYPITITRIHATAGTDVEKAAQLFTYSYKSEVEEGDKYGEKQIVVKDYYEEFRAPVDGKVTGWKVRVGEEIQTDGVPLVEMEEPCLHEVQFGGMCANCGKNMTELVDLTTGRNLTDRANINLSHSHMELKVSQQEASRINEESRRRLLANRKLSLVVDLDQTIIHATVDPTVAEWQKDTENPNHDAVKDVRAFQLVDEGPGGRGCWYYIKLRPGLLRFLEDISKIYELHIYTMGTRAYAQNIAKIVDPDRKIFADRILSRDENGNMNAKSLHRLFPVDTKMVVIIDDRGDVWQWSDNLIKVVQYDFFVGIGDINSSFLPKVEKLQRDAKAIQEKKAEEKAEEATTIAEASDNASAPEKKAGEAATNADDSEGISALEQQLVAMAGGDNPRLLEEQTSQADQTIAAQQKDRPLLKKQELLDKVDEQLSRTQTNGTDSSEDETPEQQKPRHNLLHDDDVELDHLEENLTRVHHAFYDEYDRKLLGSTGGRIAELRGDKGAKRKPSDDLFAVPDIKDIMPKIKEDVLKGTVIVFSGVVPLSIDVQISDIALWAKTFGARVQRDLTSSTTHVVATRQRKTHKVKIAARRSKIKIVTVDWLLEAFSTWQKPDEEPYKIEVEPEENGAADSSILGALADDENGQILSGEDDITGTNQEPDFDQGVSPTDNVDWGDVDDELKEFLGSDSEDEQSDDSHASDASGRSRASRTNRKRKRGDLSAENSENESADESATLSGQGSKLQRRKKQAMERVTSLTNMSTATDGGLPSPDTTGPEEAQRNGEDEGEGEAEDEDEDWGSEAEAEFEAEFAKEEAEEDGDSGGGS